MRYALIDPKGQINRFATDVDPTVQTKAGWKWLPAPFGTQPTFDAATEIVVGPTYTVGEAEVTETWTKRSKTAEELDTEKQAKLDAYDMLSFEVNFDQENRIRALEGKQAITKAQYATALKARL